MLVPLVLGLTLASSAEAGITEKPGTFERQQSGDCSGYRTLTRDMVELANAPVEDSHKDSIQTSVTKKLPDGNWLQIYTHDGEIIGNVNGTEWPPIESALWSPSDTSTACRKERADFRTQALLLLDQASAGGFIAPVPIAEFEPEATSSAPTASKNSAAARKIVEGMKQAFGRGACVNAQVFGDGPDQVDENGGYWRYDGISFMAGGYELSAKGVDAECVNSLMQPSQKNSPCVWGTKALATEEFPGMEGSKVLGAQCFDSVEAKRELVPEPMSSTGFRFERKGK